MPEAKFDRDTQRFDCLGLDLNRPVDSVKPGKFPILQNVRSYQAGRIEPRDGLTDIAAVVGGITPTHSCRRLNDPANSTWTRIVGAGTHLAYGQAAFTDADSGYSGDPLALVPYRPDQSPESWMYVTDRSRMRKINRAGTLHTIGLAAPTAAPTVALAAPSYKVISEFDATAGWAQAGTAGAPTLLSAGPGYRTTTTITQILYDTGTTGWACVNPASMVGIGVGERLTFNPGGGAEEIANVQEAHPGSVATTIGRIIYDSGTSGACSLVLATPVEQVQLGGLIRNTTVGPENARILAVVRGPDGITSIRISTTNTWAATNVVQVLASFRVYLANNHAAAETVRTDGVRTVVTVGTGTLTLAGALDLSLLATGVPTQPDDYMHISMRVDRPDLVTEIKVQVDLDSATNDFTRNFSSRSFRASDLTPSVRNAQPLITTRAQVLQRAVIDTPIQERNTDTGIVVDDVTTSSDSNAAVSQEFSTGDVQWSEMLFRLSDLVRVGTDDSRTLQNVASIRVTIIVTGTVTVDMDSWWVGGGYGPDVDEPAGIPYVYRYRARVPATGATSNWSPALRGGAVPFRQQVTVTPTQYAVPTGTSFVTGDFVLDVQRFGGQISVWHYVGTTTNAASPSFTDKYADDVALALPTEGQDHWQPWPIISTPVSGTTGSVAGTSVNDAATGFNTSWAPGTEIKIGGVPFTIYNVISTSRLETVENMGSQNAVTWQVDEPVLMSQNLACLWGDEQLGAMFAVGDLTNPGRLYFSNGNDPDSTRETNYLDITSPSEPLMNGVMYNLRSYVFSSERMFQILATNNPAQPWVAQEIPNGKGLFSRWALTRNPAPILGILCRDGIYATTGGAPVALTDGDLYPLFPNEGNIGVTINTIAAPNIVAAQQANLRLEYYDEYLYFDFLDTAGQRRTLVLSALPVGESGEVTGGWFYDVYTPGVVFHYGEEGPNVHALLVGGADTTTGRLYQYGGNSDNGTAISCIVRTPSRDQGDARANKLYGDIMLDCDAQGVNLNCTPGLNDYLTTYAPFVVSNSGRRQTAIPLSAEWQTGRNIALNIAFSVSTSARPLLYIWEPRWTFESAPISALAWEISPTTFGMENFKHMGLVRITHVSTADLTLTVTLDGVAQTPVTITQSSGIYTQTVFRAPVYKGKLWKLRLDSLIEFRLDPRDTFFQIKEWGSTGPYRPLRLFGDYSLVEG